MKGEKRLSVSELVEGVMPCIRAKQYSETYISGFQQIFNRMLSYCEDHKEQYFSTELAEQFLLDCYGVQPGTVERRCSRAHRAMDLLSDYQHFGTVMIRRRLNRVFPTALESASEGYLKQMELRGRRKNTVLSHRKFLLRFTDFLDSIGIAGYEYLTPDAVNQFIKVILCNYSNSVAMEYYGILRRFLLYLAMSGNTKEDLSLKLVPVKRSSTSARIPTTLTMEQIESILSSVDRESPQGKRDYAVLMMTIFGAKGDKDRMVGISDSMLEYMRNYRANPMVAGFDSEYFFPAPDGGFYDTSTIYAYFRDYLFMAGIPHRSRGKGPRVHDLRHSFAVHVLNKWSSEGKDMYTCLPILRVYLGHSRLTATEKYLRLIPDAYGELTNPFKDRFQKITEALDNEEKV